MVNSSLSHLAIFFTSGSNSSGNRINTWFKKIFFNEECEISEKNIFFWQEIQFIICLLLWGLTTWHKVPHDTQIKSMALVVGALSKNSKFIFIIMYACMLIHCSRVQLFATPWTVARQAPLSMGFSKQEYWSGLLCPPPGDLPDPGIKPVFLMSSALAGRFFTISTTWEAPGI